MNYSSPKDLILQRLHGRPKPNGFISCNAKCCVHNGETPDHRGRGGFKFDPSGSVGYNCFNCKYRCLWTPGSLLPSKMKNLMIWMGVDESDINKLSFDLWRFRDTTQPMESLSDFYFNPRFECRELPPKSNKLSDYVDEKIPMTNSSTNVLAYLYNRDPDLIDRYQWYHSDELKNHIIIPYFYEGKIVGWTARNIKDTGTRYLKDSVNDFIFNIDNQKNRNILLIVEGIIDAVNLDCASCLGSNITEKQKYWINSLGKKVVVFPDFDKAGKELALQALENGWYISLPPRTGINQVWEKDVKDASDAVKKYGKLYTLSAILSNISNNKDYIKTQISLNY